VVGVGLGVGAGAATALARDVDDAVAALGFPREERPWTAHITLGRFRDRPPKPPPLDPERTFGRFRAGRLVLFRSVLAPGGALHEAFREMSLLGGT
jgi:2'-5' RNA ligase